MVLTEHQVNHKKITYDIGSQLGSSPVETRTQDQRALEFPCHDFWVGLHFLYFNFVSGIYFKYDLSALKVEVTKDREGLIQFLVRLCASVGGLVATSHIVCSLVKHLVAFVCCYSMPESPKKSSLHTPASLSSTSQVQVSTNLLSQSAPISSKQTLVSSPNVSAPPVNKIELTKSCWYGKQTVQCSLWYFVIIHEWRPERLESKLGNLLYCLDSNQVNITE